MMTKDFEPITEVAINQDDFGEGIANKNFHLICLITLFHAGVRCI